MTQVCLADAVRAIERLAPPGLAEAWDRSGLQVGDHSRPVKKVLLALDAGKEAVDEAARSGADLIITHHPFFFKPLKNIDLATSTGKTLSKLIKNDIALYCAHTNLDRAVGGVNDLLAARLGLVDINGLGDGEELCKVVVTVPVGDADKVRDAMACEGAGRIGVYSGCAYQCVGEGFFTPGQGANPAIGEIGRGERVEEARIEMSVGQSIVGRVTAAAAAAHPYEEPVIDVYPTKGSGDCQLGRMGKLEKTSSLAEFSRFAAKVLDAPGVRFVGDPLREINTVAVVGGSGASYWPLAQKCGADLLLTGDVAYHGAIDALAQGFALVDVGHGPSERVSLDSLAGALEEFASESGASLEVVKFATADPFHFDITDN